MKNPEGLPIQHSFVGFWLRMGAFGAVCSLVSLFMWRIVSTWAGAC